MEEYTYRGNKRPNDGTEVINTSRGEVAKGGSIKLGQEEVDSLSEKFDFVKSSSSQADSVVETPTEDDTGKDLSEAIGPEEWGTRAYGYGDSESGSDVGVTNTSSI